MPKAWTGFSNKLGSCLDVMWLKNNKINFFLSNVTCIYKQKAILRLHAYSNVPLWRF